MVEQKKRTDKLKILVVEDELIVADEIQRKLKKNGYTVIDTAVSRDEAVTLALRHKPDLVLMDIKLQGEMVGVDAAQEITDALDIPIVYLTAYSDRKTLERAKITEPYGYLLKPFSERELHVAVQIAVYKHYTERKLRETERKFRVLFEESLDVIIIVNSETGRILDANPRITEVLGYKYDIIKGKQFSDLFLPEPQLSTEDLLERTKAHDAVFASQNFIRQDRSTCPMDLTAGIIPWNGSYAVHVTLRDVTERKLNEDRMYKLFREREVLIREVHHRVKNNLQVISSLLDFQAEEISDEKLKQILQESKNRITSISRIHEQLYRADDIAQIDISGYLNDLIDDLIASYGVTDIEIKRNIQEICLDIGQVIPIGLIINELISNSLKHAFKKALSGVISVTLSSADNEVTVSIQDTGPGLPPGMDPFSANTVGLRIVRLVARQLGAVISYSAESGAKYSFTFTRHDGTNLI
ncbi:MAG: sensor histidine kinase [Spirochaetia bacterium]